MSKTKSNLKKVKDQYKEELLEKIERHLGSNWSEQYPGVEHLTEDRLIKALEDICAELK